MACREDPNWIMCKNAQVLDRDSVYTKTIVEADGSFGGCPSGDRTCTAYGACNPVDPYGDTWKCRPTNNYMGVANISQRYPQPQGSTVWDMWKYNASKLIGGSWFSTQAGGNCDDPSTTTCQWRVVETVKTVNATCVNANLHKAVIGVNPRCFSACPDPADIRSNCWISCFYSTLFGGAVNVEKLVDVWLQGYESSDPSENGCPPLPL
eukprot:m.91471 g.91471  ORF g.91471 m.91471 type:complete len:208 (-) comp11939_c0_seq1:1600-2223(-)